MSRKILTKYRRWSTTKKGQEVRSLLKKLSVEEKRKNEIIGGIKLFPQKENRWSSIASEIKVNGTEPNQILFTWRIRYSANQWGNYEETETNIVTW